VFSVLKKKPRTCLSADRLHGLPQIECTIFLPVIRGDGKDLLHFPSSFLPGDFFCNEEVLMAEYAVPAVV
ncbi:MAG TPA: hypothetical protein PLG88_01935, partial [Chitinophagaceae bacterium]|nr:hypothetical protein [Chitinophagaceae bacterium]